MTKKKKKNSGKKRQPVSQKELAKKMARTNLADKLQKIYHDNVSLETSMTCVCTCCKVAMPQINYSEFVNIATTVWNEFSKAEKIELICTSIEYWFKNEFPKWKMESLVKPCMFLDDNNKCKIYDKRPLNCRLFGLWPKEEYEARVDKFAKAYEPFGVKREDLPLAKQCDKVTRNDDSKPLNMDVINDLFKRIDSVDAQVGDFSAAQMEAKENYRTFHDWLLLKVYGDDWLANLTTYMMAAKKEDLEDQIRALKVAVTESFEKSVPDLKDVF